MTSGDGVADIDVKRYRSKPAEVEAVLVTDDNTQAVADWCEGEAITFGGGPAVWVHTINGEASAITGEYVVRGPNDFYPCDADTFAQRWEEI